MNYLPFTTDMVSAAAYLLAHRHRNHRSKLPQLPTRFEDSIMCSKTIETLLTTEGAEGVVAMREGQMIAYLIGVTKTETWGRSGYVHLSGYGLAENASQEIMQDLYALLGEQWNQKGCFNHYIYISVADSELIEAFFNLGFGKARIDALLDLQTLHMPQISTPKDMIIRRVTTEDGHYLAGLADTIWKHQTKAPRWHPMTPEEANAQPQGWAEIAETPSDMAYLAFEGGNVIGSLAFYVEAENDSNLLTPPQCRYMTAAATKEDVRGRGIGSALTWHGLNQIREHGDKFCLTNWQSANLLAARFWPRFGFQPVAYRLARLIHPSIAWAKAS
jgi:ribosomal protein S18 acetylase RimI-like enzyme